MEAAAVGGREGARAQSISCLSRFLPLGLTGRRRERDGGTEGGRERVTATATVAVVASVHLLFVTKVELSSSGLGEFPHQQNVQKCEKIRRIGCIIPHCNLQHGITQPILQLFFYISVVLL